MLSFLRVHSDRTGVYRGPFRAKSTEDWGQPLFTGTLPCTTLETRQSWSWGSHTWQRKTAQV